MHTFSCVRLRVRVRVRVCVCVCVCEYVYVYIDRVHVPGGVVLCAGLEYF